MKQLILIKEKKYPKRKTTRAISLRGANHIVLKSESMILRKNAHKVRAVLSETQKRFGIKIRALGIMSNHIHLILRVSNRKQFADSLRFLAGQIALKTAGGKLWSARAWSRVLKFGRDMATAEVYVWKNAFKAGCFSALDTAYIVDGVIQI